MKLPWILPLGLIVLTNACQRPGTAEEWELATDLRLTQVARTRRADPDAPRRLEPRGPEQGPPSSPLVFLQEDGSWRLIDGAARVLFSTPVPADDDDAQPTPRVAAAFFSSSRRAVFLVFGRRLMAVDLDPPRLRTVADLGAGPLCGFDAPFEPHVLQEEDLGETADGRLVCIVLRDAPDPDTRRACTLAVNPDDGVVRHAVTRDAMTPAGGQPTSPPCVVKTRGARTHADPGWTMDEAACAIIKAADQKTVSLLPEEEAPSPCRIRFEGRSSNGRFGVWCTADPDTEYAGGRCQVIDLQRTEPLDPAVDLPWESPVRWDTPGHAALVGDTLFLLDASPVRWVPLNATALFVR